MKVRELIEVLAKCDTEMEIATHADNYTSADAGAARVALMSHYAGPRVVIGNFSKRNINHPNWFLIREIDGGRPIPNEWPAYGENKLFYEEQGRQNAVRMLCTLRERGHDNLMISPNQSTAGDAP